MDEPLEEEFYDHWRDYHDDNLPSYSQGLGIAYLHSINTLPHKKLRKKVKWKTKDGRLIRIKDLDDNHLNNIIKFLKRENEFEDLIDLMIAEQNYRNLKLLKDLKNYIEPDYYKGFY